MTTLITGGAGFIGTHLTRHLLGEGCEITILDNFSPQVHANNVDLAADIAPHVRLVTGDIADPEVLRSALEGAECVIHLAAETGTGQSMYEVCRYERTNLGGIAAMYELLAKSPGYSVKRIVVASSRAVYGEGAYCCERDGTVYPTPQSKEFKQRGIFDPVCPVCGGHCVTMPTPETAPFHASSFYGLTKQVQEQTAILFGEVLRIPTFALRYQNVYGPGQSLDNPYTGILAIFSNLARIGQTIRVFEDGAESRDFVYVEDAVRATAACLTASTRGYHVVNIGSNERTSVLTVANEVNKFFGGRSPVEITGAFREGDIRHGMADLRRAKELLEYEPQWKFSDGLGRFLEWASRSEPDSSGYERSILELEQKGLLHGRA
jgi:dTDP-L-rhamnose 4-epimerase